MTALRQELYDSVASTATVPFDFSDRGESTAVGPAPAVPDPDRGTELQPDRFQSQPDEPR